MTLRIGTMPDGAPITLTTDHAAASHGAPVVVVRGQAYGPADVLALGVTAGQLAARWSEQRSRTADHRQAARLFCWQDPAGLQVSFRVAEAAPLLGISAERVRQLIEAGRLPAARRGRYYAITAEAIEAFRRRPRGRPAREASRG